MGTNIRQMPEKGVQKTWFAGLDGLRGLAALGVLITHVGLVSGYNQNGWGGEYVARAEVGVALFFVLSGFLLYRPFVAARLDGRPALPVRRYLRHRFVRIFPAYWAALTVLVVVLDTRSRPEDTESLFSLVAYYTLLQSWSEQTVLGGLQQAWTLHNELMFYLLLPLWAAATVWLSRRMPARRAVQMELATLVALAVAALTWRMWLQSVRVDFTAENFDPRLHWIISQLHLFVPGMALALGIEWGRRHRLPAPLQVIRDHPLVCCASAGAAFWAVSVWLDRQLGEQSIAQDLGQELLYGATGFFLVAPVALAGSDLPRSLRWLNTRVMVVLGLLSYSIYLWHVGVIDLWLDLRGIEATQFGVWDYDFPLLLVITVAGSIAVAAVSYLLIERPALRHKDPRSVRATRGARSDGTERRDRRTDGDGSGFGSGTAAPIERAGTGTGDQT